MSSLEHVTVGEADELELERTYLAHRLPEEIKGVEPIPMEDTYIPEDPTAHAHLRVRSSGDKLVITKKHMITNGDASEMVEKTIPLDSGEFNALRSSSERRVVKDRYKTHLVDGSGEARLAEIDVFKGLLAGLVVIDFEFATSKEKDDFIPPDCCGAEVTQEDFIAGGVLAGRSYEQLAPDLEAHGYTKIVLE